jgi:ribosome-binding factor A
MTFEFDDQLEKISRIEELFEQIKTTPSNQENSGEQNES